MASADLAPQARELCIELVYSASARHVSSLALHVPEGCTVGGALQASGWLGWILPTSLEALHIGVWGRVAKLDQVLREADRVEIYRPLKVDPKEARRLRYKNHVEKYPPGQRRR